ncbi:hypothetical protein SISSUDRAFT_1067169 [Sistotremastrum suecicum HHB10207 ss-3]|uniref:Uncharacterized protein n=1 Tax=Sistotremastrum suecicum HHB10207 ss-3 TaxID=1314776 RepID=A0A165XFH0_9AGAM|nr:hypothetical protein SISSUDRAFT_1067169 [Sistotremastrum suecicum HHB10207 ss-3]
MDLELSSTFTQFGSEPSMKPLQRKFQKLNLGRSRPPPISSENWTQIFEFYVNGSGENGLDKRRTWWPLLLVCRSWQSIARRTPALWRNIWMKWPLEVIEMHLTLSTPLPLILEDLSPEPIDLITLSNLVTGHWRRIEILSVLWFSEHNPSLSAFLDLCAMDQSSTMTSLSILASHTSNHGLQRVGSKHLPDLRELKFDNLGSLGPIPTFRNLRSLVIHELRDLVPIRKIIGILERMKMLEILDITMRLQKKGRTRSVATQKQLSSAATNIPIRLQRLKLTDYAAVEIGYLLRRLRSSFFFDVELHIINPDDSDKFLVTFYPSMNLAKSLTVFPASKISYTFDGTTEHTFTLETSMCNIFGVHLSGASWYNLRELCVHDCVGGVSLPAWRKFLSAAPYLVSVAMRSSATTFLQAVLQSKEPRFANDLRELDLRRSRDHPRNALLGILRQPGRTHLRKLWIDENSVWAASASNLRMYVEELIIEKKEPPPVPYWYN